VIKLKERFQLRTEWEDKRSLHFKGKGLKGLIEVNRSSFELNLNLGMAHRALTSLIEKQIVSAIDSHLA